MRLSVARWLNCAQRLGARSVRRVFAYAQSCRRLIFLHFRLYGMHFVRSDWLLALIWSHFRLLARAFFDLNTISSCWIRHRRSILARNHSFSVQSIPPPRISRAPRHQRRRLRSEFLETRSLFFVFAPSRAFRSLANGRRRSEATPRVHDARLDCASGECGSQVACLEIRPLSTRVSFRLC